MRILVVTPISYSSSRSGGAEVYIFELVKQITLKTSIEVTVLTSGRDREQANSLEYKFRVRYLSKSIFTFPFLLLLNLRKYIRSADIVVENISKFPLITPAIVSKASRRFFIAVVHHIHGRTLLMELPVVPALLFLLYEYVALFVYSLLKVPIITVSETSEAELRRLGFKNIRVVHPTLTHSVDITNPVLHKLKKPLLVYIGRVKKYKRLDHFVKACRFVVEKIPDAICLIVGKGDKELETKLRKIASMLGISDKVKIFVSNVNNNLKFEILKKAWLYVFTSAKEGFGISVIEALSQGVLVVAYDIPTMRELLRKCSLSITAKNGDIRDLAKQCINLLKNKELLWSLSIKVKECAKSYNSINMLKGFLNAIKTFIAQDAK